MTYSAVWGPTTLLALLVGERRVATSRWLALTGWLGCQVSLNYAVVSPHGYTTDHRVDLLVSTNTGKARGKCQAMSQGTDSYKEFDEGESYNNCLLDTRAGPTSNTQTFARQRTDALPNEGSIKHAQSSMSEPSLPTWQDDDCNVRGHVCT